jgi:hypothetical protein
MPRPARRQRRRFAALAAVTAVALGVALGACAGPQPGGDAIAPAVRPGTRIVVLRTLNLAGTDLARLPAIQWESGGTLRMLVELDESRVPLAELPFADGRIPFDRLPDGDGATAVREQLRYEPRAQQLIWREPMQPGDRQLLTALAPESAAWRNAIDALYAQSRGEHLDLLAMVDEQLALRLTRLGAVAIAERDAVPARRTGPQTRPVGGPQPRAAAAVSRFDKRLAGLARATDAPIAAQAVITAWDWHRVAQDGRVRVGLDLLILDTTDAALIARRVIPPHDVTVPARDRLGAGVDMRRAMAPLVGDLLDSLLR